MTPGTDDLSKSPGRTKNNGLVNKWTLRLTVNLLGECDFTKYHMFLDQLSNQPIIFEGQVYSLSQV